MKGAQKNIKNKKKTAITIGILVPITLHYNVLLFKILINIT